MTYKNGHLMFNIEDASGEISCLLMNRKGDDRIIEHAQIVEAGLMPDDVIGVLEHSPRMEICSTLMIYTSQCRVVTTRNSQNKEFQ